MESSKPTCAKCGADLPLNARYCGACGSSLRLLPSGRASGEDPAPPPDNLYRLTFDQDLLDASRQRRPGGRRKVVAAMVTGLVLVGLSVIQLTRGLSAFGQIAWVVTAVVTIGLAGWLGRTYATRRSQHGATNARRWLTS